MKVFVNPGHAPNGIPDPGAISPTGLRECDVALNVGNMASEYLQQAFCETKVLQSDSLSEVCQAANAWQADVFVSIHCNSFSNPSANGMEVYTSNGKTSADSLASFIMQQMQSEFPELNVRGKKEANFYVLNQTNAPAVLVELAFISNPREEAILRSEEGKDKFAKAIARGLTDWNLTQ